MDDEALLVGLLMDCLSQIIENGDLLVGEDGNEPDSLLLDESKWPKALLKSLRIRPHISDNAALADSSDYLTAGILVIGPW